MGNPGTTITGSLILGALTLKASDFVKYVLALFKSGQSKSDGLNGLISLIVTAILGIGVVWLVAQTQWADEVPIGDEQLGNLSVASLVVLGLVISSFGSLLYDLKKAIDRSESASTPRILPTAEATRLEGLSTYFQTETAGPAPTAKPAGVSPGT
jgi:hypothetical protein